MPYFEAFFHVASAESFRRAIALDSSYADAWSGLSLALALYPYFQGTPAPDVYDEVHGAAERALRLDSTLSQPHVALGLAYQHDRRWDTALAEFEDAVRLNPHDVEARVQLGRPFLNRGRFAEGHAEFLRAREDDPASALVSSWIAYAWYVGGELDSAVTEGRRARRSRRGHEARDPLYDPFRVSPRFQRLVRLVGMAPR